VATFGRYEILDKLGEGAMGVVYRARDPALNRVVALKMLSAELGGEEEIHQRFQREAEAIGRLSHPTIVTVYDLGQAEGQLYMAMELLEGDDLRKLMERRVDIPLPDRVRIMLQIAEGLSYAHSRDVVHRDVKPANLIVTTRGRIKILDFGLARVASQSNITRRGVILGTPDYMSPEQAMGRSVTHRSDQFAAGAVFYEFLTGSKPFRGKTLHSVLYQILSEEPEPMLTLNPGLPARLAAVVHGMMRKDPERRFASMEDVRRELSDQYVSLRRTQGRSAMPQAPAAALDEVRPRVRDLMGASRTHLDAGRLGRAMNELESALALDPGSEELAEQAWRIVRAQDACRSAPELDEARDERVSALLARAAPSQPEEDARRALLELALLVPDDRRLAELLRERAAKARAAAAH
jgi:eukaryotic-like serine/threonine-protein kinase